MVGYRNLIYSSIYDSELMTLNTSHVNQPR